MRPTEYAQHILEIASISMRSFSFQGSFLAEGRKKTLERRIIHALQFDRRKILNIGGMKMKTTKLVLLCTLIAAAIVVIGSCATGKKASVTDKDIYKKLSGTWINTYYDGFSESHKYYSGKYVIKRDGTYDGYANSSDTSRTSFGEIISIDEKWIDSEGNFWYKSTTESLVTHRQNYELGKIHSSGNVWELTTLSYEYPNELDPNHGRYRIYYRQE
jgi:hypothetical protein